MPDVYALCISSDYDEIHLGVIQHDSCRSNNYMTLQTDVAIPKQEGNKQLVPALKQLIQKYGNPSFIGVNVGPAPYTSLRIVLATVNGYASATGTTLVEVDALAAYSQHYTHPDAAVRVALLNAFNQELFYAVNTAENIQYGYAPATDFLIQLAHTYADKTVLFYGNGVQLHKVTIDTLFGKRAQYDNDIPSYPPLELIAQAAYKQWLSATFVSQAMPRYLKQVVYHNSINVR